MHLPTALTALATFSVLCSTPSQAQWTTQDLSSARAELAAAAVGDYAIFAGGRVGGALFDRIDLYNDSTGTWTQATLSVGRNNLLATSVNNYALFAGGSTAIAAQTTLVDVFDATTTAWTTATLSTARAAGAATTVGKKAIFAGGIFGSLFAPSVTDVVDIYDSTVGPPSDPLAWSSTTLTQPRGGLCAATVGTKALFAGGLTINGVSAPSSRVDIYDDSTGTWSTAELSLPRRLTSEACTVVGNRVYFAGGETGVGGTYTDIVDVYDDLTGLWTVEHLSVARTTVTATSLGNTAIFASGFSALGPDDTVDMLNVGTGKWDSTVLLSGPRNSAAAVTLGGKVFIAGGNDGSGAASTTVTIYQPAGINYCQANINSTGAAATLTTEGTSSLLTNNLVLRASCVPDSPFLFFHGDDQKFTPFGNGHLCVGGVIKRIGLPALASGGLAERIVDLPSAGIHSPGMRRFQCWFRDAAAGGAKFNTSDAIEITFTP